MLAPLEDSLSEPSTANLDLDELRQAAEGSLYFFAKGILGFDWLVPHIHGSVCDTLQNADLRRVLFVLPRGWLKTTLCSISFPIWAAVRNPNIRILLAQNNRDNARAKLRVIRDQFEKNQFLRTLWPDVLPGRSSVWSADSLCLTREESHPESTFECIGVRGQSVSRHYNVIIEDDTVAPDFDELGEEMLAPTHEDVTKAVGWHRLATPLLTNPKSDRIIVVGTRWYEHDLISHIQETENYVTTTRSCLENEDGESDIRGEVTYPERFDQETLNDLERTLGIYFFNTLMLNNPVRSGDMVFKSEWIREYELIPPRQSLEVYTTIDPATDPELSTGRPEMLDYSVVMTCGKDLITGYIYVLDYFRARCSPGEHAAAIFDHVLRWRPIVVGYEDVAYQKSIDYWLKDLMRRNQQYFLLEPIKRGGKTRKEDFIMGLQPVFGSGAVHIRPYMRELVKELLSFPRGAHDDLIDAMAMQLQLWRRTKSKREVKRGPIDPADAYSVEAAVANIRSRHRDRLASPIFQPLELPSLSSLPRTMPN